MIILQDAVGHDETRSANYLNGNQKRRDQEIDVPAGRLGKALKNYNSFFDRTNPARDVNNQ